MVNRFLISIICVAGAIALAPYSIAGGAECFADWSMAATIVQREGLMTVEQLSSAARSKLKGDIIKTTLCKENDVYVFRLVVRGADGRLTPLTVDAKNPFGG